MGLEKEVEGTKVRLVRIALDDYYSPRECPGQGLRAINKLRAVAPEGCGLWAERHTWTSIADGYVSWTIVVAAPTGLSEERWREVRRQMSSVLQMADKYNANGLVPVFCEEEAETLEAWEKEFYDVEETMGSFEEVRIVLEEKAAEAERLV
jgi:hypothetical protein